MIKVYIALATVFAIGISGEYVLDLEHKITQHPSLTKKLRLTLPTEVLELPLG